MSDLAALMILFGLIVLGGFFGGMGFAFVLKRKLTVAIETRIHDWERAMDDYDSSEHAGPPSHRPTDARANQENPVSALPRMEEQR